MDKLGVKAFEIAASHLDLREVPLSFDAFVIRANPEILSDHPVNLASVEPLSSLSFKLLFSNSDFTMQLWSYVDFAF